MSQFTLKQKQEIQAELAGYVNRYPSQSKAANSLVGTSAGTVNAILKGKFENISDAMFARLHAQIKSPITLENWTICETTAKQELEFLFDETRECRFATWVTSPAGTGKSATAKLYAMRRENTFLISCSEDMHRGDFIREIARSVGVASGDYNLRNMLIRATDEIKALDNPLLIIDEADKLVDVILYYFITIYNRLEGHCGIVILSTNYIKRRMENGLFYNKKGFDEIYSRIGRKFVDLSPISSHEVSAICRANGITDDAVISKIISDSRHNRMVPLVKANGRSEMHVVYDLRGVSKVVGSKNRMAALRG